MARTKKRFNTKPVQFKLNLDEFKAWETLVAKSKMDGTTYFRLLLKKIGAFDTQSPPTRNNIDELIEKLSKLLDRLL